MSDKNSENILKRANELMNDAKPSQDEGVHSDMIGSFDNETLEDEKKPEEKEEMDTQDDKEGQFDIPHIGYQRHPRYKKPALWKFIVGLLVIVFLLFVMSLLMPYIPPA